MQTTYYKSYRSAPHAGNIIHLSQLRRRQDLAQRDSLARQPEEESAAAPVRNAAPGGWTPAPAWP